MADEFINNENNSFHARIILSEEQVQQRLNDGLEKLVKDTQEKIERIDKELDYLKEHINYDNPELTAAINKHMEEGMYAKIQTLDLLNDRKKELIDAYNRNYMSMYNTPLSHNESNDNSESIEMDNIRRIDSRIKYLKGQSAGNPEQARELNIQIQKELEEENKIINILNKPNKTYDKDGNLTSSFEAFYDSNGYLEKTVSESNTYNLMGNEKSASTVVETLYNDDGTTITTETVDESYYGSVTEITAKPDGSKIKETIVNDARTRAPYTTYTIELERPDGTKTIKSLYEDYKGDRSLNTKEVTTAPDGTETTISQNEGSEYRTTIIKRPDGTRSELEQFNTGSEVGWITEYDENDVVVSVSRYNGPDEIIPASDNDIPARTYLDKFGSENDKIARIISDGTISDMISLTDYEIQEHINDPESEIGKNICDILEEQNWEEAAEQMLLDAQNIINSFDDFNSGFSGFGGELGEALQECLDQTQEDAIALANYIKNNNLPAMHLVERLKELIEERKELMYGEGDGFMNYKEYLEEKERIEEEIQNAENEYQTLDNLLIKVTNEDGTTETKIDPSYNVKRYQLRNKIGQLNTKLDYINENIDKIKNRLIEIKLEVKQVYGDINIYNDTIIKYKTITT